MRNGPKLPDDTPIETSLEFLGRFRQTIITGTKRVSIRLGWRRFAPQVEVCGFRASVNSVKHLLLSGVDFEIFKAEGWNSVSQTLYNLRKVYPNIDWKDKVTIVEFHLNIPTERVEK